MQFYAGRPGGVRVLAGDREYIYSLTLPQLWDGKWEPPAGARRGIPQLQPAPAGSLDLWPWLAIAGAFGLLAEWLLYGKPRGLRRRAGWRTLAGRRATPRSAEARP